MLVLGDKSLLTSQTFHFVQRSQFPSLLTRRRRINHVGSVIIGELAKEPPVHEVSESIQLITLNSDYKGTFFLRSEYEFVFFVNQVKFDFWNIILGAAYF